ncbi:cytochrome c biogenesis CcdA family protein [Terrabacter sp. LjRoot27]|uniref:cytochrome c biogenesis CcdA family protein n=1 Tax=Terrabacter sp. LjRoot27 TaxID=3342306 RepID=UPI003ECEBFA2
MTEVGLITALAAGGLSLISPCSALLLPSFFAYAFSSRTALVARTGVFYMGLLLTLVPLGTGAGAASTIFYGHRQLLVTVAGWLLIAMGVLTLVLPSLSLGGRWSGALAAASGRAASGVADASSARGRWLSTLVLGAVYGLAGFCSGPVLGAILTLAATQGGPVQGGLLLAIYALGMALPLFVLALLWDRFDLGRRRWLRGRPLRLGPLVTHSTSLVSGLLFVVIGVLFIAFDGTAGIVGNLGLDTSELEFAAQDALAAGVADVPVWVAPVAVALVASIVAVRRATTREHTPGGMRCDSDDVSSRPRRSDP